MKDVLVEKREKGQMERSWSLSRSKALESFKLSGASKSGEKEYQGDREEWIERGYIDERKRE